jgi:hypothetical protein
MNILNEHRVNQNHRQSFLLHVLKVVSSPRVFFSDILNNIIFPLQNITLQK